MTIFPRRLRVHIFVRLAAAWMLADCAAHAANATKTAVAPDYVPVPFVVANQNKFFTVAEINGKRAILIIDTGAPLSCIDESRARHFGLKAYAGDAETPASVITNGRQHRVTVVPALTFGPLKLMHTRAVLIDLRDMNRQLGAPRELRCDGIIGLDILRSLNAVIDCAGGSVYFKTNPDARSPFPKILRNGGWSSVPMRISDEHLFVNGRVNGASASFVVDTGSPCSAIDRAFGDARKIAPTRERFQSQGIHFTDRDARIVWIKHLVLGSYDARLTRAAMFDLSRLLESDRGTMKISGLAGVETLRDNFAVIDCESLQLNLRKPNKRDEEEKIARGHERRLISPP